MLFSRLSIQLKITLLAGLCLLAIVAVLVGASVVQASRSAELVKQASGSMLEESAQSLDWIAGVSPTKLDQGFRELTDEQQVADRRQLVVLAHSIHKIADDALLQMRRELDPATRQVYRIVSRPDKNPGTLTEAYHTFKQAVKAYKILRDRLGVKMQELRDYEETLKVKSEK
jgi:hypothetical protein